MPIDMAVYMANRRAERRAELFRMSGNACAQCGATEDLEFNHINRFLKLFSLSGRGLDGPWERIVAEWRKCQLLCGPCHKKYTRRQWATGEIKTGNSKRHIPWTHGTMRRYQEEPCRCTPCTAAKSAYRRKEVKYDQVIPT